MDQAQAQQFEPFLTKEQASDALRKAGISIAPVTLGEYARRGTIPFRKVGGRLRFKLSELLSHYEETSQPKGVALRKKGKNA